MPALRYIWAIMTADALGTPSIISWQKKMWEYECKVSSHYTWVFTVSYCLPDILGIYSGLVWNLNREDMRTPGVYSGVVFLAGNMVTGISPSANYGTSGSIIFYAKSRVPPSFAITIFCSRSIVDMSWSSTSSGSVYAPGDIVSRSVSGSISSMCEASVSPESTPVISSSHIGQFLWSSKYR